MTIADPSLSGRWRPQPAATAGDGSPFTLATRALAILTLILLLKHAGQFFAFPADRAMAGPEDLVVFHAIGDFAARDALASAYDPATFAAALPAANKGAHWLNPPHAALLFSPFSAVPYSVAKAFWLGLTLAATIAGAMLAAGRRSVEAASISILSPAFLAGVFAVNLGGIVAGAMIGAMRLAERRPIIAGAFLSFLTIKPQYGVLIAPYLLASGRWRAIAWGAVLSAVFVGGSLIVHGSASWMAFFDAMPAVHAQHGLEMHRGTVNLAQLFVKAGAPAGAATLAAVLALVAAMIAVYGLARRDDGLATIGWVLVLTPLVAPSAWIYDWPVVACGLIALHSAGRLRGGLAIAAAAAWAAPVIPIFLYGRFAAAAASLSLVGIFAATALAAVNARMKPLSD
ncbi:MAG: DUF2029 domain-containing protein [Alphaproteobacteria bacterium]|nr:DUF2029 domain-containing protein [Alphaproteobacteria bacterium]